MARDAVWELLSSDTDGDQSLAALGGAGFMVIEQYATDQRPDGAAFIVICWRHTNFDEDIQANAERNFDLYVHIPVKVSTRFGRIDAMIDRCDELFRAVEDATVPVVGEDGWQLDYVGFEGRGMDFEDEGYQTICKSASYMALASKVIAP
ncbi:hypothetical protein [Mycobacterium paragordonae]|uniref:hypothetical protein n=1 Tax=Mycobacterium paragordonae TaxID=1389713 RepID=UPI0010602CD9|nr:hypothetical protein [Mycobacterium paragordonae]TDL05453.1 hypothetical protein EUA05_17920 [Mycobacterium paragordonae]